MPFVCPGHRVPRQRRVIGCAFGHSFSKADCPIEIEPGLVHLQSERDGFAINRYFVDHPEMILGRQTSKVPNTASRDFTIVPTLRGWHLQISSMMP